MVVGAHWAGHHRVFRYVTALDGQLTRLTLYWLLAQVLTPFATKVLTGEGAFQVRFIFYASVQAAAGILFLLMLREIHRHRLYRPDTPPRMLAYAAVRTGTLAGAFLVSIPVAFVTPYAYVCWIVFPFAVPLIMRIARRRRTDK